MLGPDALDEDEQWAYMISFLPGLKSAGGTEEILRNTIGERVLGLPPEPRLDKGVPFSELRAKEKEAAAVMNLALSDEQEFLREAARGALSRVKTIEAAREALEGGALPDLWPTVVEAGWPGLLVDEDHGGAGLGAFDAMLVAQECGRVLAGAPLLGLLPASGLLQAAGDEALEAVAAGDVRPAWLPARPPGDLVEGWTVDPRSGKHRPPAPRATVDGDRVSFSGEVAWVPDAPGADLLVVVGVDEDGAAVAARSRRARRASRRSPATTPPARSGTSRSTAPPAGACRSAEEQLARAWYLAQALLAAESLGSGGDRAGDGRAVRQGALHLRPRHRLLPGHQARPDRGPAPPGERPLAAVLRGLGLRRPPRASSRWRPARRARPPARRSTSPSRQNIVTHGGIGATWEHDAPLFFRRAQLCRRLLGGAGDATDRVAAELLAAA